MHDVIVFAGPTLSVDDIKSLLDAEVRPPASRGDVLDAALDKPAAIGIIDGYFARVPSVWHKEILWAMSKGVHVFGAASMGALRAAELEPFGMRGVGSTFEQFKSGALTDDDEVAVVHAPREFGYSALSDAMVNIRGTLAAAEHDGIISRAAHETFEAIFKARPYPERTYALLFSTIQKDNPFNADAVALKGWLPHGRIDQKREDALLMLRRMAEMRCSGWPKTDVKYRFAQTDAWEALRNDVINRRRLREREGKLGATEEHLLNELVVTRGLLRAHDGALARALCLELAERLGVEINARAVEAVIDEFRRERGLISQDQFDAWLKSEELTENDIVEFFQNEATIRAIRSGFGAEVQTQLLDYLRASGELGALRARTLAKQQELELRGECVEGRLGRGLSEVQLWRWYFEEYLGDEVPVDIGAYALSQRTSVEELRSAVLREYFLVHRGTSEPLNRMSNGNSTTMDN